MTSASDVASCGAFDNRHKNSCVRTMNSDYTMSIPSADTKKRDRRRRYYLANRHRALQQARTYYLNNRTRVQRSSSQRYAFLKTLWQDFHSDTSRSKHAPQSFTHTHADRAGISDNLPAERTDSLNENVESVKKAEENSNSDRACRFVVSICTQ